MPAWHPEQGTVVDGFHLEKPIHKGGMAMLWRVTRPDMTLPMVMKVPLLRPGENPATVVGFEVEQMILPRLSGRHVPKFIASGDFERPYIVMELIDGSSLKARLNDVPLPVAEVASIGAKIAIALHDLHRQHVIHLDVKPSNVILRDTGEAVLIDFGLSRHDQLPDLLAEEFHVPIGTGAYISPEQLLEVRSDPRSDQFALGVLLYFFVTGERPFGDPANVREWRRRLYRDPPPPRAWKSDIPPWLQEVILRCLEVDPNARYETAAQLAFHLQHPEQIPLTARAERIKRDGFFNVARRRWTAMRATTATQPTISSRLSKAPIVLAAIDLSEGMEPLAEALRVAVRRVLDTAPGARLACLSVLKASRIALDARETEGNPQLRRLAALKHWARPLNIPPDRITYHVFESPDPGAVLLEYAQTNHVDHIVLGARSSSALRRYLGSVSSRVVAEAPCTVTVVRTQERSSAAHAEAGEPRTNGSKA